MNNAKKGIRYGLIIGALGLGLMEYTAEIVNDKPSTLEEFQTACAKQTKADLIYKPTAELSDIVGRRPKNIDKKWKCFWEDGGPVTIVSYMD